MNIKKLSTSILLGGAAISGLFAGQSETFANHVDTAVVYANDKYTTIKDLLVNRIHHSEFLSSDQQEGLADTAYHLKDDQEVLDLIKELELQEAEQRIRSLNLSDEDLNAFLLELEHLDTPEDVVNRANDKALKLAMAQDGEVEVVKETETTTTLVQKVEEWVPEVSVSESTPSVSKTTLLSSNETVNNESIEKNSDDVKNTDATLKEDVDPAKEEPATVEESEVLIVEESELPKSDAEDTEVEVDESEKETVEAQSLESEGEETSELSGDTYTIEVEATAYSRNQPELSNFTYSGIDLRNQANVIAVDPNVIPLGSKIDIPGYGTFIAGDTGSAIKGNRIDIHMEDLNEAVQFGRQHLTITVHPNGSVEPQTPAVQETVNLSVDPVEEWTEPVVEEEATTPIIEEATVAEETVDDDFDFEIDDFVEEVNTETVVEVDVYEEPTVEESVDPAVDAYTQEYIEPTYEVEEEVDTEPVTEETHVEPVYEEPVVEEPVYEEPVVEEMVNYGGRSDVGAVAGSYVGTPYVWGGSDPSGFDCSGLTSYSYRQVGVELPRTAQAQSTVGEHVDLANVQPGDLVFWGDVGSAYHTGIYVGDGSYIHAPDEGQTVSYGSLAHSGATFARRP